MKHRVVLFGAILMAFMCVPLFTSIVPASASLTHEDLCGSSLPEDSVFCSGQQADEESLLWGPDGIITKVIQILIIVVTIISTIVIVIAGFRFVTSGGNPQSVGGARNAIIYAAVGLIIALFAQMLVSFVLSRLGDSTATSDETPPVTGDNDDDPVVPPDNNPDDEFPPE